MSQAPTLGPVDEVVDFFARGPTPAQIAAFRLSDAAQERLRELLQRNSVGQLTQQEEHELDQMVLLDDIVSLIRARAQRSRPSPTSGNSLRPRDA